jgi:two-component system sensor histidine kinase ChvG
MSDVDASQPRGQILLSAPVNTNADGSAKRYAESFGLKYSPLARKIVTFNLVALCMMMTGILYLNQFDEGLISLREQSIESDSRFLSEALIRTPGSMVENGTISPETIKTFHEIAQNSNSLMQIFDAQGNLKAYSDGVRGNSALGEDLLSDEDESVDRSLADMVTKRLGRIFNTAPPELPPLKERLNFAEESMLSALNGNLRKARQSDSNGQIILTVALPLVQNNTVAGALVLSTNPGEIDGIVRKERGQILRIFFLAMVINVILSLALANTIAHPLQELAEAAERGGATNTRRVNPERIEIPDLTGRPDEIGYLAGAMTSMTSALYDRIDANESFAADVAHEIKNPLTSLRSAVDTMKYASTDEAREKLLKVIGQDVTRLDRLVTDISNASRLDKELVRDEMQPFDLHELLNNLVEYNQDGAQERGGELVADLWPSPIMLCGLEGRLAQVFVNLITNAISFTQEGGVITVRTTVLGNGMVRVTVEDNGPGIPDDNLDDVFSRFYSERPDQQFGNHSGLGLAISKQIVDAHSGSIHAENVRPDGADTDTPPLGARFVVDLPA